jgi:hypothetical protein
MIKLISILIDSVNLKIILLITSLKFYNTINFGHFLLFLIGNIIIFAITICIEV